MSYTEEQIDALLRPIRPHRVSVSQGQSHVEAYEIAAHLTRLFGFPPNWRKEITELAVVHERIENNRCWVAYRCQMRLWIYGEIVSQDVAIGDAQNLPPWDAHDFAAKSAVSQALKRCAKDLGDQFGLSLYRKGSLDPVVGRILGRTASVPEMASIEDYAPVAEGPPASPAGVWVEDPNTGQGDFIEPDEIGATVTNLRRTREAMEDRGVVDVPIPEPEQPSLDDKARHPSTGMHPVERVAEIAGRHHTEEPLSPSNAQFRRIMAMSKAAGLMTDADIQAFCIQTVEEISGRTITSRSQLTSDEADVIIDRLRLMAQR